MCNTEEYCQAFVLKSHGYITPKRRATKVKIKNKKLDKLDLIQTKNVSASKKNN